MQLDQPLNLAARTLLSLIMVVSTTFIAPREHKKCEAGWLFAYHMADYALFSAPTAGTGTNVVGSNYQHVPIYSRGSCKWSGWMSRIKNTTRLCAHTQWWVVRLTAHLLAYMPIHASLWPACSKYDKDITLPIPFPFLCLDLVLHLRFTLTRIFPLPGCRDANKEKNAFAVAGLISTAHSMPIQTWYVLFPASDGSLRRANGHRQESGFVLLSH